MNPGPSPADEALVPGTSAPRAGSDDRAPAVREMFDRLAPRYDLANRVLSLGVDGWWRRQAIAALGDASQGDVLDLCAGTLDLTLALVDGGARRVVAVDFAEKMLEVGRRRLPEGAPVEIHVADARALPLPDRSVDGIVSAFGLRNVPGVDAAVAECARVLRPGGRLVVLDFFQPETALARFLHGTWNRHAVPVLGGLITGYGDAYRYLQESMDAFGTRAAFEQACTHYGMPAVGRVLVPPVAALVIAKRIEDADIGGPTPTDAAVVEENVVEENAIEETDG